MAGLRERTQTPRASASETQGVASGQVGNARLPGSGGGAPSNWLRTVGSGVFNSRPPRAGARAEEFFSKWTKSTSIGQKDRGVCRSSRVEAKSTVIFYVKRSWIALRHSYSKACVIGRRQPGPAASVCAGRPISRNTNTSTNTSPSMISRGSMRFVSARPPLDRLLRHLPDGRHTVLYGCFDSAKTRHFAPLFAGGAAVGGIPHVELIQEDRNSATGLLARRVPRGAGCIKAPHLIGGPVHYARQTLPQRNLWLDCAGHRPDEKRSGMAKSRVDDSAFSVARRFSLDR